jgi:hypothetical protein
MEAQDLERRIVDEQKAFVEALRAHQQSINALGESPERVRLEQNLSAFIDSIAEAAMHNDL